ncbi:MAG: NAD(P)/FAD-dependent oxidoreductase [Planctomycetota bacterium]|nr:MAG: NAD(P)/FAD-dependent oxidoreductase [Planctomycetota bacterium]
MDTDTAIIGAGVVGLAIAAELADGNGSVCVLERHKKFGQETSGRNSEVIHAGIYYPKDSLKARLCVEGKKLLYGICEENGIGFRRIGKLIVATDGDEVGRLEYLKERGNANGVDDLKLLTADEVNKLEPNIRAVAAIHSPSTGIIDTHGLMHYCASKAGERGAEFLYGSEVVGIEKIPGGYKITVRVFDNDKKEIVEYSFRTRILINCAGLDSDRVAGMAGIDTAEAGYDLRYCKGRYFSVAGGKSRLISRLVYPVPPSDTAGLGIHATLDLQGRMRLGPDSVFIDRIKDYDVDADSKTKFFESAKKFLPFLELEDLAPDTAGIRPKLTRPGGSVRDFVIKHEEDRNLPGLINLIGIESPGLTSSPAIAKHVKEIVHAIIG